MGSVRPPTDRADDPPTAETPYGYFHKIETLFIRLRGAPLLLAPVEYHVAKRWHDLGIPLRLIEDKLVELFAEKLEQEDPDKRARPLKFYSLRYWRPVIETAWKAEQALTAPATAAEPDSIDVETRLGRLADALPTALPGYEVWREKVLAIHGPPETVETELGVLDAELLATVPVTKALQGQLDERLALAVERLGDRLASSELTAARERLQRQLMREMQGLPVLSLFGPEAT